MFGRRQNWLWLVLAVGLESIWSGTSIERLRTEIGWFGKGDLEGIGFMEGRLCLGIYIEGEKFVIALHKPIWLVLNPNKLKTNSMLVYTHFYHQ